MVLPAGAAAQHGAGHRGPAHQLAQRLSSGSPASSAAQQRLSSSSVAAQQRLSGSAAAKRRLSSSSAAAQRRLSGGSAAVSRPRVQRDAWLPIPTRADSYMPSLIDSHIRRRSPNIDQNPDTGPQQSTETARRHIHIHSQMRRRGMRALVQEHILLKRYEIRRRTAIVTDAGGRPPLGAGTPG